MKVLRKRADYAGLKAEFNKIVWPDKDSVTKQTTAVVIASVILGADYCTD